VLALVYLYDTNSWQCEGLQVLDYNLLPILYQNERKYHLEVNPSLGTQDILEEMEREIHDMEK
jgi:hypothetical protein